MRNPSVAAGESASQVVTRQAVPGWDIAIDVGGTFVDIVARSREASGRWRSGKRLRGPADTAEAIAVALADFLREEGIESRQVARLRHGTTIATNALLELREEPVALITTAGFADVLTLGRQNRRDLAQPIPQPPVPPHICPEALRFELTERIDAQGNVATPLDRAELGLRLDAIAAALGPRPAPPAIAVCLLFAPLNPAHELGVAAAIRARWPDAHVSLSHQVDPRLREFERTLATVLDAYVRPAVTGYLARLDHLLARQGLPAPWIMRSLGGLAPSATGAAAPLTLAMSGPAAAALAVQKVASRHSTATRSAIGIDIGGTTTDICLVADASVLVSDTLTLGGLEFRVPSADIESVAIGGGSILQVIGGLLQIGPHSAGSFPGPACFARGGRALTLTDAALLAGLLPTELGRSLTLDPSLARKAAGEALGIPEHDAPTVAFDAVKVAEAAIAEAIRRKAFSRGIDPREAILVAAGGGGALHAAEVADRIGCRTVIVPRASGVLAASGLMHVGLSEQTERPIDQPLEPALIGVLATQARADGETLRGTLATWSGNDPVATVCHELEMGYQGQGHGLAVPFAPGLDDAATLAARFDALHAHVRGHAFQTARRIIALRSIATQPFGSEDNTPTGAVTAESLGKPTGQRLVAADPPINCPVWPHTLFSAGGQLTGPALIDAVDTTVWLPLGWLCEVAADSSLLLTVAEQTS